MRTVPSFFLVAVLSSQVFGQDTLPDYYGESNARVVFRENKGQVVNTNLDPDTSIKFVSEGTLPKLYLQDKSRVTFAWSAIDTSLSTPDTVFSIRMSISGETAKSVSPIGYGKSAGMNNYYLGHCPQGVTGVGGFQQVLYPEVYGGIDMKIYSGSKPKLSFICHPGSDPEELMLAFDGQDSIGIDVMGAMKLYLENKWITLREAMAYQVDSDNVVLPLNWTASYEEINDQGLVGFVFDSYDPALPLILEIGEEPMLTYDPPDPRNLGWSTYAGGNEYDEFMGVDRDAEGNVYACGYTMDMNFPINTGYQVYYSDDDQFAGFQDALVMKFEGSTKRILWATYLGGASIPGRWEQAADIAVYSGTNPTKQYAFVTGSTQSSNFPFLFQGSTFGNAVHEANTTFGRRLFVAAFQKEYGLCDWSTTHGAPGNELWQEDGTSISVDGGGIVAVGGRLEYATNGTFPYVTPNNAYT